MYIPSHFNEERLDVLHELIRSQSLATLVTYGASGLIASHIPVVLDPSPTTLGALGTLQLDLELMSNRMVELPNGSQRYTLGFRFLSLPGNAENTLQRLITQLEMKRRSLAKV